MLPNFLIVGAAKAGTTSLYNYLKQHPEIFMSPVKEPHFFSFIDIKPDFKGPYDQKTNEKEIISDYNEYKGLFKNVTNEKAIGECSNSYLFLKNTEQNIKKYIPHCKIIIILRNPIERAYSHYLQFVMLGQEDLTFEAAMEKEEVRKKLNWRWHYQLVGQGLYYHQVKRYLDRFGLGNVKIHLFEELKQDPEALMKKIFQFLCVDRNFTPEFDKIYNKTGLPKNLFLHKFLRQSNFIKEMTRPFTTSRVRKKIYSFLSYINYEYERNPLMNEETRRYLINIFRDDCLKLQELINIDLSVWFD